MTDKTKEAVDLIWRTFDRPFTSEDDYQSLIAKVAEKIAQGRLVIMRRSGNEIKIYNVEP